MREGRWVTVTESEFDHERRGLEAIREQLPDSDPWRAWSNFTFTANTGHVREVDLLVVTPGGVCMIELKDWHGSVTSENGTWVQTTPGGRRRTHGNPLHLVNRKAKELAGLLALPGNKRVWVAEAVCFTDNSLRVRLPAHDQNGVYTVHQLVEMLGQPPRDERRRITAIGSREIEAALKNIGIRKSDAQYKVGPYDLERKSFDSGPTWADYLARHSDLPEAARVRIYLSERGSDASLRQSVENAARREAAVLGRFKHPGVVELKQYFPSGHAAGPSLIFDYHPDTLKLDEYLVQYGEKLDILGRMALVRQLAETMRSAHSSRIHHRALAARSVLVVPRPRGRKGRAVGEEAAWLTPHLQISDWQIATQRSGDSSQGQGMTRFAPTALSAMHLADDADAYLAPELTALNPDPVHLDVYGLGVLTYLLVTGKAPAASQAELLARLEAGRACAPAPWWTACRRTWTSWSRPPPPTGRASACPAWTSSWSCWRSSRTPSPPRPRRPSLRRGRPTRTTGPPPTRTRWRPSPVTCSPAGGRSAAASAPVPPAAPSSSAIFRPKPAGPARWPC